MKIMNMNHKKRILALTVMVLASLGAALFIFLSANMPIRNRTEVEFSSVPWSFWLFRLLATIFILGAYVVWQLSLASKNPTNLRTALGMLVAGIAVFALELLLSQWNITQVLVDAWWPMVLYLTWALVLVAMNIARRGKRPKF